MAKYTLEIKIPNAGNKSIYCDISLVGPQEDHPDDYFRLAANRLALKRSIQEQSARQLDDKQLDHVIESWIREIKQGRFKTTVPLDLEIDNAATATASAFDKPLIQRPFSEPLRSPPPATPKAKRPQPTAPLSHNIPSPPAVLPDFSPINPAAASKPPSAIEQLIAENDSDLPAKTSDKDSQEEPHNGRSVEKRDDDAEF